MSSNTPENISFASRGLRLAAHLYKPTSGSTLRNGAAVVICHPWTSIKEQPPANYARVLSQAGFICLAYDARVEDIKYAVTYLISREEVNNDNIGVLGICASGGYALFAAQTDLRVKAVATSAAVCVGTMARRGYDKDSSNLTILATQLENAGKDRNSEITGETRPSLSYTSFQKSTIPHILISPNPSATWLPTTGRLEHSTPGRQTLASRGAGT
ncbi:Fc.00g054470.m01.CDS01 [Cosmosporella sp. VM-42]